MDIVAFYGSQHIFSNFHASEFVLDKLKYNCVEQFYQGSKAMYTGQDHIFKQIMETKTPYIQKQLGRNIIGFHKKAWRKVCLHVMYTGLKAKFDQNPNLKKQLIDTGTAILVEASPTDYYWGAGANKVTVMNEKKWPGQNHMGELLMKLRELYLIDI